MLNAQFRPLDRWPGERAKSRKSATFRSTYPQTLDLLEYELNQLRAREIIIQVDNLTINDIRNDGMPRGSWCPRGGNQGVVLSFESPKGAMSFPCDRYTEWQDNLRAIGLSLEALRSVDRHGVTRGNEQYRGWSRLEAPGGSNGKMDKTYAAAFIAGLTGGNADTLLRCTPEFIANVCKSAKSAHHPDHGKDESDRARRHELFVKIGQAQDVLLGGGK